MAQPYVGEIRMFAGNFAPLGWSFCNGEPVPISENDELFRLIGTMYGGDGEQYFNLPDLRGRIPIHRGTNSHPQTEKAGVEQVTLNSQQMAAHSHTFLGSSAEGNVIKANGNLPANSLNVQPYINASPDGNMNATSLSPVGGNQPHPNFQPYLCVNFIISQFGIFPSQT